MDFRVKLLFAFYGILCVVHHRQFLWDYFTFIVTICILLGLYLRPAPCASCAGEIVSIVGDIRAVLSPKAKVDDALIETTENKVQKGSVLTRDTAAADANLNKAVIEPVSPTESSPASEFSEFVRPFFATPVKAAKHIKLSPYECLTKVLQRRGGDIWIANHTHEFGNHDVSVPVMTGPSQFETPSPKANGDTKYNSSPQTVYPSVLAREHQLKRASAIAKTRKLEVMERRARLKARIIAAAVSAGVEDLSHTADGHDATEVYLKCSGVAEDAHCSTDLSALREKDSGELVAASGLVDTASLFLQSLSIVNETSSVQLPDLPAVKEYTAAQIIGSSCLNLENPYTLNETPTIQLADVPTAIELMPLELVKASAPVDYASVGLYDTPAEITEEYDRVSNGCAEDEDFQWEEMSALTESDYEEWAEQSYQFETTDEFVHPDREQLMNVSRMFDSAYSSTRPNSPIMEMEETVIEFEFILSPAIDSEEFEYNPTVIDDELLHVHYQAHARRPRSSPSSDAILFELVDSFSVAVVDGSLDVSGSYSVDLAKAFSAEVSEPGSPSAAACSLVGFAGACACSLPGFSVAASHESDGNAPADCSAVIAGALSAAVAGGGEAGPPPLAATNPYPLSVAIVADSSPGLAVSAPLALLVPPGLGIASTPWPDIVAVATNVGLPAASSTGDLPALEGSSLPGTNGRDTLAIDRSPPTPTACSTPHDGPNKRKREVEVNKTFKTPTKEDKADVSEGKPQPTGEQAAFVLQGVLDRRE